MTECTVVWETTQEAAHFAHFCGHRDGHPGPHLCVCGAIPEEESDAG